MTCSCHSKNKLAPRPYDLAQTRFHPLNTLQLNDQKEEFSYAYIHAVASVAGCPVQRASRQFDQAGVDLSILSPEGLSENPEAIIAYPRLDIQVKCTAADVTQDTFLHYPLNLKNYNELRQPRLLIPRLLVVIIVPSDLLSWLTQSEISLSLHHCAYWVSLKGAPESPNRSSVTVYLPRNQIFTPETLRLLMQKITRGESL